MLPFEDRYTRQRQLPEVGLAGQARLEASFVELSSSHLPALARVVAADYLRRAGVPVCAEPQVHPLPQQENALTLEHFQFDGPTQVAAGALMALRHIRSVLGLGQTS